MKYESYILPPSPSYPLFIVAKRYWVPEFERNVTNPAAQTLIVLHSTSFHKETWEACLEDLFALAVRPNCKALIREAWAIDCPNHGEAGERNKRTLRGPDFQHFSCERYAEAVHRFLSAGPTDAVGTDFRRRNLVGIGHSLGANAMILLQAIQPAFTFSTLIIIEPMLSADGPEHLKVLREKLVNRARKRTKCWPTLEQAKEDYSHPRRHGAKWDPRVLDLFISFALHWKTGVQSYGLSCTREQEVAMYMDTEGPIKPVGILDYLCLRMPVHIVLGQVADLIPAHVHPALVHPKSSRCFASIKYMNVGHLIPQEVPTQLADHILTILTANAPSSPSCRL